mmetsp:Transcript_37286/g.111382  ORF Transcript_37286/g.111382 Transcript_37286/m.111382 type:complete len:304 (-) Transcript_37286:96-1007(-)
MSATHREIYQTFARVAALLDLLHTEVLEVWTDLLAATPQAMQRAVLPAALPEAAERVRDSSGEILRRPHLRGSEMVLQEQLPLAIAHGLADRLTREVGDRVPNVHHELAGGLLVHGLKEVVDASQDDPKAVDVHGITHLGCLCPHLAELLHAEVAVADHARYLRDLSQRLEGERPATASTLQEELLYLLLIPARWCRFWGEHVLVKELLVGVVPVFAGRAQLVDQVVENGRCASHAEPVLLRAPVALTGMPWCLSCGPACRGEHGHSTRHGGHVIAPARSKSSGGSKTSPLAGRAGSRCNRAL